MEQTQILPPPTEEQNVVGILVGGGPAPGINGVISSAALTALDRGWKVIGIYEGFKYLMEGRTDQVKILTHDDVTKIHATGGTILHTSRANPTKSPVFLEKCLHALNLLKIKMLITIGGDDTASSGMKLAEFSKGVIRFVHVPKTIDNDLLLPSGIPTFGFRTAQAVGQNILRNLMADSYASPPRWYFVVSMGRQAGHLALGMGFSAGCQLTLIPEEWGEKEVHFSEICDIVQGTILKRLAQGKAYGVVVLAEGLVEKMSAEEINSVFGSGSSSCLDAHGHLRLDEIDLGTQLRTEMKRRFEGCNTKFTFVAKNVGYELRCADPIPFDVEYTRILGSGAVRFLANGGTNALVAVESERLTPIPFSTILDPRTGKSRVRPVDTNSLIYRVAREFMIRLIKQDLQDHALLQKMAELAGLPSADAFVQRYEHAFVEATRGGDAAFLPAECLSPLMNSTLKEI